MGPAASHSSQARGVTDMLRHTSSLQEVDSVYRPRSSAAHAPSDRYRLEFRSSTCHSLCSLWAVPSSNIGSFASGVPYVVLCA